MKTRLLIVPFAFLIAVVGCSSQPPVEHPPPPADIAGYEHHPAFDVLRLELNISDEKALSVETDGSGDAVSDGFKMMAAAPLGCLQGGMYAGLCLAMAPFFPIIAAARVEDADIVEAELLRRYRQIESYGLGQHLESRVQTRLADQGIPVFSGEDDGGGSVVMTLRLTIPPVELEHSGYKGGSVDMRLPYIVELLDSGGEVLTRKSDKPVIYVNGDTETMAFYARLDQWVDTLVTAGVDEAVVEWQPRIQLDFTHPGKHLSKGFFGRASYEWTPVDSLTPRLEWRPLAASMPASRLEDVTDLSYEIDVFAYGPYDPTAVSSRRVVARATGLQEPTYELAVELLPCQRYYWAPRARFRYRGNVRTTSVTEPYVLLTPGRKCRHHAWQLPE